MGALHHHMPCSLCNELHLLSSNYRRDLRADSCYAVVFRDHWVIPSPRAQELFQEIHLFSFLPLSAHPFSPTSASQPVPLHATGSYGRGGKRRLLVPLPHLEAVYLRQVTLPLWTPGSSSVNEKPDWHEQFSGSSPLLLTKPETEIAHVERKRSPATVAESEREGQSPPQAFPSILQTQTPRKSPTSTISDIFSSLNDWSFSWGPDN